MKPISIEWRLVPVNMKSYEGKEFIIISNEARIRMENDLSKSAKYKQGDAIPPGSNVGDFKVIPKRTPVIITNARADDNKNVLVFAQPASSADASPSGWTLAANLEGDFLNEIIGLSPDQWTLPPLGNNFTVTDKKALLREGKPSFAPKSGAIPAGTLVIVTEASKDTTPPGRFVKVSRGKAVDGASVIEDELGWTAATNLTAGWSDVFGAAAWTSQTGPNAAWELGKFIGAKVLVNIVGTGGELEQITLDTLEPYLKLIGAAAKKNVIIGLESGFRTFEKQKQLFDGFKAKKPGFNLAAAPGRSNHQNGKAFDLNTRGFDGSPVYDWLKKNGPAFGFIRTVNKEHWHWEYRPADAAVLAKAGQFKTANVKV
jgi:hypothetical protein